MGLAERFKNSSLKVVEDVPVRVAACSVSQPVSTSFSIEKYQDELFEKIASIPCWFEYDFKTQHDLIRKFLVNKGLKNPDIMAKILQHSILGFGVFDYYLAQEDISYIMYEEGKPFVYTKNGQTVLSDTAIPVSKVRLAVKNMINMSQSSSPNGFFSYRIADFWVQLSAYKNSKIKFSVTKIDNKFIQNEISKYNLPTLLSDF